MASVYGMQTIDDVKLWPADKESRETTIRIEPGWRYCEARFHTKPPVTPPRAFSVPEFSAADFGRGLR